VGLISSKDLLAMGNSIKKSFEALKKIGGPEQINPGRISLEFYGIGDGL